MTNVPKTNPSRMMLAPTGRQPAGGFPWACGGWVMLAVAAAVFCVVLLSADRAQAQITTEALIGDSVSDIGTRYSDVDEAVQRFNNRDVIGARQFLEAARAKDPKLPPVEMMMARMYLMTGNLGPGRAALERTAMQDPGDPEPYIMLADQAITSGRSIEAEALYDKGLELLGAYNANAKRKRNLSIRCLTGRSLVSERRKDWQAAEKDLQSLVEQDPSNAMAHYRLGRAEFMLGKAQDGYNQFKEARKLDSNLPHEYVATALVYDQLGQENEARQAYERAIAADKDSLDTILTYVKWLIKSGSIDKAEQQLASARQAHPDNADLLILSGVAARMNKKMKPAEDYFVAALSMAPSNGSVINQLAQLLADQPDTDKRQRALEFATMNSKLNSESADAQITLAWILYQLGRGQEANNALRAGLQAGTPSPDSSYLVAKMMVDQNRLDAARQLLNAALEADTSAIFVNRAEAQSLLNSLGSR